MFDRKPLSGQTNSQNLATVYLPFVFLGPVSVREFIPVIGTARIRMTIGVRLFFFLFENLRRRRCNHLTRLGTLAFLLRPFRSQIRPVQIPRQAHATALDAPANRNAEKTDSQIRRAQTRLLSALPNDFPAMNLAVIGTTPDIRKNQLNRFSPTRFLSSH
jgi:hypothetical protein